MPGGTGSLRPPFLLSSQNSSSVAGTQIGGGLSRQFGSRASSGPVSITAPERMCAPMVEAFSITQTEISGLSCLSRMANARPDGTGADGDDVVLHHVAFDRRVDFGGRRSYGGSAGVAWLWLGRY